MKRVKNIIIVFFVILFIYPNIVYAKFPSFEQELTGYIVSEYESGEIISSFNEDEIVPIASITKLMTYILVREAIDEGVITLKTQVTVTDDISAIGGSSLNLVTGKIVTISQLLEGLIIVSGNDASYALAKTISGSEELFVEKMNEKAKEIGMENALFINSTGLPDTKNNIENTMSIKDIYIMTKYILDNYIDILKQSSTQILSIPELGVEKVSTIPLLGEISGIDGLKTGTTTAAGYCLVSTFNLFENENLKDRRFISITMGAKTADEREEIIRDIVNYIDSNMIYGKLFNENEPFTQISMNSIDSGNIEVFPLQKQNILFDKSVKFIVSENIEIQAKAPLKKGEVVGVLSIETNNGKVYNFDLITKEAHARASIFVRIKRTFSDIANESKILLGF